MAQNLEEFLNDPNRDWGTIKRLNGWTIEHEGNVVTFRLNASDGEGYIVRLLCDQYPDSPPGVVFVNERGEMSDRKAWPNGSNPFLEYVKPPGNCFICAPLTKEGVHHHKEWMGIWAQQGDTLMDVFNFIHGLLNNPQKGYQGRCS